MHYQVTRNGQSYGPYTLEELQRYVGTGNVLATDLAKSEAMSDWMPVSQLLAQLANQTGQGSQGSALPYGAGGNTALGGSAYPPPPNLHWALVLVFSIFCSVFLFVWLFVQASWLKRIQPASQALWYYAGGIGALVLAIVAGEIIHSSVLGGLLALVYVVLLLVGHFSMKASLEEHYNSVEPMGLKLSPVMTFFFNTIYFQYHFNRINEAKLAASYGAPRSV